MYCATSMCVFVSVCRCTCKHDIVQCMHPHIQVSMLAIYTCILVVLILEREIFLMGRAFMHKRIPWFLHVLDNYCTVAIFPMQSIVCCTHLHNHTPTQTSTIFTHMEWDLYTDIDLWMGPAHPPPPTTCDNLQ